MFEPPKNLFPLLDGLPGIEAPDPFAFSLQSGLMVCSAVSAAVNLHIPDALESEPQTAEELAQKTSTHAPSLYILLRALAGIGIFREVDPLSCSFVHTERSRALRSEAMAELVQLWGASYQWDAWSHLPYTIQTGNPALEELHGEGVSIWTHLHQHPEEATIFQQGLTAVSNLIIPALVHAYDFSNCEHLVDVGGGYGRLGVALLERYSTLNVTLFDLPNIIEHVHEHASALSENIAHRSLHIAGNFFEAIPAGADVYTLKNILMDWPDEEYLRILQKCQQAMEFRSRLLIIEPVIGEETPFTLFFSLQMAMMMRGAHHRSLSEHIRLANAAGFRVAQARPLGLEQMLLEHRPDRGHWEREQTYLGGCHR